MEFRRVLCRSDGLNLVPPVSGNDRAFYEEARPDLSFAASGAYGALPLTLARGAATGFGLHPSATGPHDIWTDGTLAIVHTCGLLTTVTRTPFDPPLSLDDRYSTRLNSSHSCPSPIPSSL